MKILAIIPARGGSKGIPKKNIVNLLGQPLLAYTILAAQKSKLINRIVLSTNSQEIARVGRRYGAEVPFLRPKRLAQDKSPTQPVIEHCLDFLKKKENYLPDFVVILQPTSPLRRAYHIDQALKILIKSQADSVVSVTNVPHHSHPYHCLKIENGLLRFCFKTAKKGLRRQDLPEFYIRNGAIYAFRIQTLLKHKSIYGQKILPYLMGPKESINIDEKKDLILASFYLRRP